VRSISKNRRRESEREIHEPTGLMLVEKRRTPSRPRVSRRCRRTAFRQNVDHVNRGGAQRPNQGHAAPSDRSTGAFICDLGSNSAVALPPRRAVIKQRHADAGRSSNTTEINARADPQALLGSRVDRVRRKRSAVETSRSPTPTVGTGFGTVVSEHGDERQTG